MFRSVLRGPNVLRGGHMSTPARVFVLDHVSETMGEKSTHLYLAMHRFMHHKTVDSWIIFHDSDQTIHSTVL